MTARYRTQAFTFQKNDTNETDRIFSVFSNDYGRLDLFAKAIRKINSKLRGGINIFSFSDIEFIQGKNRKTLTDASALEKFDNIFNNPQKFSTANKIGEVLNNFLKGEERDDKVFNLLYKTFSELNNEWIGGCKASFLYYYFLWSFLALQGYGPEVTKCADCHGKLLPDGIYFSFKEGGILCEKCSILDEATQRINSDTVKLLRLILKEDWAVILKLKISDDSRNLFQKVSDNYCLYILSGHSFRNNYIST